MARQDRQHLQDMEKEKFLELPKTDENREAVRVVVAGQEVNTGAADTAGVLLGAGGEGLSTRIDTSNDPVFYIGEAEPGTATSAASWRVLQIDSTTSSAITILYADGDTDFDNIWDNRAALSYS